VSTVEPRLEHLRDAVVRFTRLADEGGGEARFLGEGKAILADLIRHDDWLPDAFAQPSSERYQQYLLHCDALERFSIVSFVWAPGQSTPIHDHRVWGMVGVLRGLERNIGFRRESDGRLVQVSDTSDGPGAIALLSPLVGDIHQVANADPDDVTVSIHVYGGNIGKVDRAVFDPVNGTEKPFVSSFANTAIPNIWN